MGTWPLHLKGSYITSCIIIKGVIKEKCSISKESLSKTEKAKPWMPKILSSQLDGDIFFLRYDFEKRLRSVYPKVCFSICWKLEPLENILKMCRTPFDHWNTVY